MRQIQSELSMQKKVQQEDKKKIELLQNMIGPERAIFEETHAQQIRLDQYIQAESIKNIQIAYKQKLEQIGKSARECLEQTAAIPSSQINKPRSWKHTLSTEVIQICQISPKLAGESVKLPAEEASTEHNSKLTDLQRDINRSLLEKQDQLRKLKHHYIFQESLIESQINELESQLTCKNTQNITNTKSELYINQSNIQSQLQMYQDINQKCKSDNPVQIQEVKSITSLPQSNLVDQTTYSYSLANSLSRKLQDHEIAEEEMYGQANRNPIQSALIANNRPIPFGSHSVQSIQKTETGNQYFQGGSTDSTEVLEQIYGQLRSCNDSKGVAKKNLILVENQLNDSKKHYQLTVPEINCPQLDQNRDSLHCIDPPQMLSNTIFSNRLYINSDSSTVQSNPQLQLALECQYQNRRDNNLNNADQKMELTPEPLQTPPAVLFQDQMVDMFYENHADQLGEETDRIQLIKNPFSQNQFDCPPADQFGQADQPSHDQLQNQSILNSRDLDREQPVPWQFNDHRKSQSTDIFQANCGNFSSIRSSNEENCFTQRHQIQNGQMYNMVPNSRGITIGSQNLEQTSTLGIGSGADQILESQFEVQCENRKSNCDEYVSTFGRNYQEMINITNGKQHLTTLEDQFNYTKSLISPTSSQNGYLQCQPQKQDASNIDHPIHNHPCTCSMHQNNINNDTNKPSTCCFCLGPYGCNTDANEFPQRQPLAKVPVAQTSLNYSDTRTCSCWRNENAAIQRKQVVKVTDVECQTTFRKEAINKKENKAVELLGSSRYQFVDCPDKQSQPQSNECRDSNQSNQSSKVNLPTESVPKETHSFFQKDRDKLICQPKRSNHTNTQVSPNASIQPTQTYFITPNHKQPIQNGQQIIGDVLPPRKNTSSYMQSRYGQHREMEIQKCLKSGRQEKSTLIFCSSNTMSPSNTGPAVEAHLTKLYNHPPACTNRYSNPNDALSLSAYSASPANVNFTEKQQLNNGVSKKIQNGDNLYDPTTENFPDKYCKIDQDFERTGSPNRIQEGRLWTLDGLDKRPERETSEMVKRLREAIQRQEQVKRMLENQRNYKQLFVNICNLMSHSNEPKQTRQLSNNKSKTLKKKITTSSNRLHQNLSKTRSEASLRARSYVIQGASNIAKAKRPLQKIPSNLKSASNLNFSTFGRKCSSSVSNGTPIQRTLKASALQEGSSNHHCYQVDDYNDQAINLQIPGHPGNRNVQFLNDSIQNQYLVNQNERQGRKSQMFDSYYKYRLDTDSSLRNRSQQKKENNNRTEIADGSDQLQNHQQTSTNLSKLRQKFQDLDNKEYFNRQKPIKNATKQTKCNQNRQKQSGNISKKEKRSDSVSLRIKDTNLRQDSKNETVLKPQLVPLSLTNSQLKQLSKSISRHLAKKHGLKQ